MKFTPITLSDFNTLKPFFDAQPYELCPYLLPSIIAWQNDYYSATRAVINGDLIVCAQYRDQKKLMLPIAPMESSPPQRLVELAAEAGVSTFIYIPQNYLDHYGSEQVTALFHVETQPNYSDYVYRTRDLAELKGNKYSKKRNLINQFKRSHVREGRVEVAPITPDNTSECFDFLEEWCAANDCDGRDESQLACEKQAAIQTLINLDLFESRGLLLRVDGKVRAFGVGARLTTDMGVLNFEKAIPDIKGLYQFFDRECARRLFKGLRYINKENDVGEPGLQKAKKSYHPVRIVQSYQLTVR